jgi:hypothetical protein
MLALSWRLTGPLNGDWIGYAQLYDEQGGWLLDEKRDSGFLFILKIAHLLFGRYGYEVFRFALSTAFTIFAVWLVSAMPRQSRVAQFSSLATALIVISIFSLKGFVQIREGIAFLCILIPIVSTFARRRGGLVSILLGTIAALAFHSGTIVLAVMWLISLFLLLIPTSAIINQIFNRAVLGGSILIGAGFAVFISLHVNEFRFLLDDYGFNLHVKTASGFWKDLYWLLLGLIMLKIRADLITSVTGMEKFAYYYCLMIASFAMPMMYGVCVVLVAVNFAFPALTSIPIRLFFTVTELAMVIIALRGRVNYATVFISIFMLADRLRLAVESSEP